MKIVYIAHPISGDVEGNIKKIIEIVRYINLNNDSVVPLVPYLADLYALKDDVPSERARGILNDTAILSSGAIDELWVFGNWEKSLGVKAEIALANSLGIKVAHKEDLW